MPSCRLWEFSNTISGKSVCGMCMMGVYRVCMMAGVRRYVIGLHQPLRLCIVPLFTWQLGRPVTVPDVVLTFCPDISPDSSALYVLYNFM